MSFHLEGPWLTTTGKLRSKRRKFASADAARKSRELAEEWRQRQQEWAKLTPHFSKGRAVTAQSPALPRLQPPPGRETPRIPSLNGGVDSTPAVKAPDKIYTGTAIKGIGTMHKSNAIPIFSDEQAVEISKMRR